jgi:hypothetical protein
MVRMRGWLSGLGFFTNEDKMYGLTKVLAGFDERIRARDKAKTRTVDC